jgi:hypothetical protein
MTLVKIKKLCNLFLDIAIKQIEKSELVLPVAYFLTKNKEVIFSPLIGLLEEDHVNEALVSTIKENQASCGLYIMRQGDFRVDEDIKVQNGKDGLILLHCEYPDGKFELQQKYNSDEEGKLIVGERHFSDTDFIGKFSGYFEESNKPINWAA